MEVLKVVGILILGAIVIVAIFAVLAYIVIKIWFTLIKSKEKDQRKTIHKTKQEGHKFLYNLISTDYDVERNNVIARVIVIFSVLCIGVLCIWFSVGTSFL